MRRVIVLLVLTSLLVSIVSLSPVAANGPDTEYFRVRTTVLDDGTILEQTTISGPPEPPPGYQRATAEMLAPGATESVNILPDVPAFNWSFGCSATSAAVRPAWSLVAIRLSRVGLSPVPRKLKMIALTSSSRPFSAA